MKYIISLALFFGLTTDSLFGQNFPSIQLDRPDQTECPFITPVKYIQIENGFTVENFGKGQVTHTHPSTLWKYGVDKNLELRLITEVVSAKTNGNTITGLLPITVGFKTALFEEKGFLPKTSFIGHITTSKIGSKEFHTNVSAPSFRFTMQHTLTDRIALAYNLGIEWSGENTDHSYIYTLTGGFSLTERIGCYTEFYGFMSTKNSTDHRFDCGLTYLVNNDFMLDISGGFDLMENTANNYISFGLSYRFKPIK